MIGAAVQPLMTWSQFIGATLVIFAIAAAAAIWLDRRDR